MTRLATWQVIAESLDDYSNVLVNLVLPGGGNEP
jgi:hypothetical protein